MTDAALEDRPISKSIRPLLMLVPFITPYWRTLVLALVALLLSSAAVLLMPMAVRDVIDHGFSSEAASQIDQYFFVLMGRSSNAASVIGFLNTTHLDCGLRCALDHIRHTQRTAEALAVRKNARSSAKKHPTGDSIEKPLRLSFQPAQDCLQITLRAVHKKPLRAVV